MATEALPDAPRSVFCNRLNALLAEAGLWSDVLPAFKGEVGHFSEKALVLMAAECWSVGFCHCR